MKYEQLSIYDFIDESEKTLREYEKSQELPPPETVPQVDEAQESIYGRAANKFAKDLEAVILGDTPSSALDTEIPTEDTDETLFSVGDTVKVVNPYHYGHEDWDYLEEWKDKVGTITKLGFKGNTVIFDDTENYLYPSELQKI